MNGAIITLTKGGAQLGIRLLKELDETVLYNHSKFNIEGDRIKKIEGSLSELVGKIFYQYKYLIFIMATGIVVRTIAPYLRNKKIDPAVIVLDEKGNNVISLLSGHIGGANEYTKKVANILGANPVITTASDVNERMAVDTLAMELNCEIEDFLQATKVTAHLVNGEKVGVILDISMDKKLPQYLIEVKDEKVEEGLVGLIRITDQRTHPRLLEDEAVLIPKNIIIGIGCRRGKSKEEILYAIDEVLSSLNIRKKAIKHIATVDIKKDEKGLIEAAKVLEVPMVIIERKKIKEVEDQFKISPFVKKTIGVGAVCEPVALLSSNKGQMIQGKKNYAGVTVAVVREGGHKDGNSSGRHQL